MSDPIIKCTQFDSENLQFTQDDEEPLLFDEEWLTEFFVAFLIFQRNRYLEFLADDIEELKSSDLNEEDRKDIEEGLVEIKESIEMLAKVITFFGGKHAMLQNQNS